MAAKFLHWTRDFHCSTVTMELSGPFNDFLLRVHNLTKIVPDPLYFYAIYRRGPKSRHQSGHEKHVSSSAWTRCFSLSLRQSDQNGIWHENNMFISYTCDFLESTGEMTINRWTMCPEHQFYGIVLERLLTPLWTFAPHSLKKLYTLTRKEPNPKKCIIRWEKSIPWQQ